MARETIGRPMEVLLVEDNLADACLAIEALREGQIKHRLTLIRDGLEAMEFLRREGKFARAPRPDLVLLDLELPKMDGRHVLAELKSDYDLCSILVVVLTASVDQQDYLASERLEVDGYMTKPVDLAKFILVVRKLRRYWLSDVILPALD